MTFETQGTSATEVDLLIVPDIKEVTSSMAMPDPVAVTASDSEDEALTAQAKEVAERLFTLDITDLKAVQANKASIDTIGLKAQRDSAAKSEMLQRPIHTISSRAEDGGEVAKALVDLKIQVEELDPAKVDFSPGFLSRILGYLPGVGTPLKRYFTRFESSQTVLDAIKNSLAAGQNQLQRDNITLADDQVSLNEINTVIERAIKVGQLIDIHLTAKIDREADAKRIKFLHEEVLFPLRQRIQDLQQSMVVNQQGVIAIEMIMRTNKELIRGVDRAIDTTMSALNIAVLVATAVADQKIVLDKVLGVKQVTETMIANTAKQLRQNVTEINKMASGTALDMDILRQSFVDITAALDDISTFRQQALPQMASTILELNDMTSKQAKVISQLEEGTRISGGLAIEVS